MKQNKLMIVCASLTAFLAFGINSIDVQATSTDVTIKIVEPELYIESVTAPQFEQYQYSKDSNTISPINNLVIDVIDRREVKGEWKLRYNIGLFEQSSGLTLGEFHFSKGKLYANSKEVESQQYQAADLRNMAVGQTIVTVLNADASEYQYVVDKKDIFLEIPPQSEIGKYYSNEVVTLESTPDYE